MSRTALNETRLLNLDLDIRARSGLRKLMTAMGPAVSVLNYQSRRLLSVEIGNVQPKTIDEGIRLFFELVESLEPAARRTWDRCDSRSVNIGLQTEAHPQQAHFQISKEAIVMLAHMRAEVAITIYASSKQR